MPDSEFCISTSHVGERVRCEERQGEGEERRGEEGYRVSLLSPPPADAGGDEESPEEPDAPPEPVTTRGIPSGEGERKRWRVCRPSRRVAQASTPARLLPFFLISLIPLRVSFRSVHHMGTVNSRRASPRRTVSLTESCGP